jgi:catechol 2,3-dioxygenase-like lactoylglutathione lyase family enzyme
MAKTPDAQESPVREATMSGLHSSERPIPEEGLYLTHLLIVQDVDRSRQFYSKVLGAKVVFEGPPAILHWSNSWLVLNTGGGPTDDKPDVIAVTPQDPHTFSSALNIRVADIQTTYRLWSSRGATFLTPPMQHAAEIRCYLRDPDGHLIEVGQTTLPRQNSGGPAS